MNQSKSAHRKLVKARASLLLDHPFFGSLSLRLEPKEDSRCSTAWTDGFVLAYNPQYIDVLPEAKLKGMLAHTVMHPACHHHTRRKGRDRRLWNMACDYSINWILLEAGLELPQGYLDDADFRGRTADEIYATLASRANKEEEGVLARDDEGNDGEDKGPEDGEGAAGEHDSEELGGEQSEKDSGSSDDSDDDSGDAQEGESTEAERDESESENFDDPGGSGEVRDAPSDQGGSASPAGKDEADEEWRIALAQAAHQSRDMGELPAGLERLVGRQLSPRLDWRELLSRFIESGARNDYSWTPPNRRYAHLGLIMPSLRNMELPEIVLAVDTSGSITPDELDQFSAEVSAILENHSTTLNLVYCDMQVTGTKRYSRQDLPFVIKPVGGGGTDYRPVFHWVEEQGLQPACMVFLTDLECTRFPELEPEYPVLWARTGGAGHPPPFGEIMDMT